jgi:23S rRNA-/tRNA-specific pseudouridylate synthase
MASDQRIWTNRHVPSTCRIRSSTRSRWLGPGCATNATVASRSALAAALVVRLETGRSRQIRRHLADAGFPVIGETASGARTAGRLLLHAFELSVPWKGAEPDGAITATSAPPADFLSAAEPFGLSPADLAPPPVEPGA